MRPTSKHSIPEVRAIRAVRAVRRRAELTKTVEHSLQEAREALFRLRMELARARRPEAGKATLRPGVWRYGEG